MDENIRTIPSGIYLYENGSYSVVLGYRNHSLAMRTFVTLFDEGHYPEIIAVDWDNSES